MAIECDEPELEKEQSPALRTEANRCRTHCSTWPSGKPCHDVTLTFLMGLIVHYTGAHELNTWQTSRAYRAELCNQCCYNECLSTPVGNICARKVPICSTYSGKTFETIPSANTIAWAINGCRSMVPEKQKHRRSEDYYRTYDWCGYSMCIQHYKERVLCNAMQFFHCNCWLTVPCLKIIAKRILTVTCHESSDSYMFCKKLTVTCHVLQNLHKPPIWQLHVRFCRNNDQL